MKPKKRSDLKTTEIKNVSLLSKIPGKNKKTKKPKKIRTPFAKFMILIAKIFAIFILVLSLSLAAFIGFSIVGYINSASPLTAEQLQLSGLTTIIYDKDGKVVSKLTGSDNIDRIIVENVNDNIPKNLKNAFVAIEDERFYQHNGIDLKGFLRASIETAISKVFHIGSVEGGSTITMQLVKNLTGDDEVTLQRKIQELWRAYELEKKLSKDEILTLYMNVIPLGGNSYGIQSASIKYFGKKVKYLTLAQCASLAGITQRPNYFAPVDEEGIEHNKSRQLAVLQSMLTNKFIDKAQFDEAVKEDLKFIKPGSAKVISVGVQPYFVDKTISDVKSDMKAKGYSDQEINLLIYSGGLKIYSTMDSTVQKAMNKVFTNKSYFPSPKINGKEVQAAMVVIDPSDGEVRAMYGGNGKKTGNTFNRATQAYRQAGSAFKPLAVYGPAIDSRLITAAAVIDDTPTYMNGTSKPKYPQNYPEVGGARIYRGLTTIRTAIVRSINVVAAKVYNNILGYKTSFDYLKKAGIDMVSRKETKSVSIALGGLTYGVTPLEMAAAYVPFDNGGMYYEPITYTKAVDKTGNTILNKKTDVAIKQNTDIVYSEQTAFIMTSMMQDVTKSGGTASYVAFTNAAGKSVPIAGKTGTTNDDKDRWFMGYSANYVASVWYGYDLPATVNLSIGTNPSANIWKAVMQSIHQKLDIKPFAGAKNLVKKLVCKDSGKYPTSLCYKDQRGSRVISEYFIKGTEPKKSDPCKVHISAKVCSSCHDIYGRYLLANSYCPSKKTLYRVFIKRLVPYLPAHSGDPYPQDWYYSAPYEYCYVHHN